MITQTTAIAADAPHNYPPDGADCLDITGRVVRPPEVRFGIEPGTLAEGRYGHFVERAFHGEEHDWGVFALSLLARTPEFRQAAL